MNASLRPRPGRHALRAPRPRAWLAMLVAMAAALALVHGSAASAGTPGAAYVASGPVVTGQGRLVFAHYVPWFTRSLDDKPTASDYYTTQYLTTDGEGGAHKAYGGYLRDRPAARPVIGTADWRLQDMEAEVRDAISAGIDGFAVDVVSIDRTSRNWKNVELLLQAAHDVDPAFTVLLQPDMSGLTSGDVAALASATAELASYPAAHRLADGRLVIAPFLAERQSVAWWQSYLSTMRTTYGIDVAFFPVLLDSVHNLSTYAPISVGLGDWGSRSPGDYPVSDTSATSPRGRINQAHAAGRMWMQAVSFQDERPRAAWYQEAGNSSYLRNAWQVARDGGADWALLPTWNDWAEGTAIAPSTHHGRALLDLMSYYIAWFKTGVQPQVVRDGVVLSHRTQPAAAAPSYPETSLMVRHGSTPASDTVEALAFLTAPAVVTVDVGGVTTVCGLPAGVSTCVAPLRPGRVTATVTRDSVDLVDVVSPYPVTSTPLVQDLQYVVSDGFAASAPQPVPDPTSTDPVAVPTSSAPVDPVPVDPAPTTQPPTASDPTTQPPSPSDPVTATASPTPSDTTAAPRPTASAPEVPGSRGSAPSTIDGAPVPQRPVGVGGTTALFARSATSRAAVAAPTVVPHRHGPSAPAHGRGDRHAGKASASAAPSTTSAPQGTRWYVARSEGATIVDTVVGWVTALGDGVVHAWHAVTGG